MSDPADPITLVVPATSEALQVMRSVASSVAARLEFPFDGVDELRVVVNEAGTMLLELGGSEIHLEIDATGPDFVAIAWTDVTSTTWPPPDGGGSWNWQVILGLCDEADRIVHHGSPGVRLVRRHPETPTPHGASRAL